MGSMEFRLLGPVQAWSDGRRVGLGLRKERLILAVLALDANRMVPVERLVGLAWPDGAPASARATVQTHVYRVRTALAQHGDNGVRLVTEGPGYVLRVDPLLVDVNRFLALVRRAGDADDENKIALLDSALDLWHGPALADVGSDDIRARLGGGLEEARMTAIEDRIEARLRLGHHRQVLGELSENLQQHPLREGLAANLMLALHRAGRTAEALRTYHDIRDRLADELGLDPGRDLQDLHQAILRADPSLDLPAAAGPAIAIPAPRAEPPAHDIIESAALPPRPVSVARLVPAQLPLGVRDFTGRAAELAQLDALLTGSARRPASLVISAVSGTAGVGKTALAVHWAHQVRDRFPDGQLYVNLRGFDPSGAATTPGEAVRGFLDAFGVPPDQIPLGVEAQAALYRSLLTGRRVLVVLDNAREAEQVRPLLPGSPGCLVVVTSRNPLTSLVAAEGAFPLSLDLMSTDDARDLLAGRLGRNHVDNEKQPVEEIVSRCARLPLALVVVAARVVTRPGFSLTALADELRVARSGLDALDTGDLSTDVRAVLSWSYEILSTEAARLFRLLGLAPGPHIGAPAAASLAGVPVERAVRLLTELTRANLLAELVPGRYSFHDLLRAYAGELARTLELGSERHAAAHRLLDHYLHTAFAAALLLYPQRQPITLTSPLAGVEPERLTDYGQALAWLSAEHPVLLAAVDEAANAGFDTHAWQLPWALADFLDYRGHWQDQASTQLAALDATRRLADRHGQAHAHRALGRAHHQLGRDDEAGSHYRRAIELFADLGDRAGQAHTHLNLALVHERRRRHREALEHGESALTLYREAGDHSGQANALNTVGWVRAQLGDHRQALALCEQALRLLQVIGDRRGEATTWDSLGYAHHHLGGHREAVECYQRALDLFEEIGDRRHEADTLTHLGDTRRAAGDLPGARHAWQRALTILDEVGHPDADQVRVKLRHIGSGR
jgi:DNA-binding SARP family transcriptional activator/tetratricopeptide (TPR) repeat protein